MTERVVLSARQIEHQIVVNVLDVGPLVVVVFRKSTDFRCFLVSIHIVLVKTGMGPGAAKMGARRFKFGESGRTSPVKERSFSEVILANEFSFDNLNQSHF